jgi:hypothetical protein
MTKYSRGRYVQIAIFIVIIAALAAASGMAKTVRTDRDRQKVATMTEQMKTVCVGRFLIDLPEKTEYAMQGAFLDGFDISVFPETDEAFKSRITARETALRNPGTGLLDKPKKLETAKEIQVSGYVGKMFVFGRNTTYGFEGKKRVEWTSVEIELYAHANGFSVDVRNDAAYPDRLDWPLKLLAQIALNPENKIPNEPGFCIDHAYFREPLTVDQGERITLLAAIPGHPDIPITFDMTAGITDKEGLLARNRKADAEASSEERARTKKLGFGPREINGISGEQSLERYHEYNGKAVFGFMWQARGTKDDLFRPSLELELLAGVTSRAGGDPVGSSLSEKALLDLWYKMSSSIRVRPTDSPRVGAAEPPALMLGTVATAGDTCPFSGWWACNDGGDGIGVLGGQRQYRMQGQRMPQALLLPPQTLWEKVRGVQPSFEADAPSSWKLVDRRTRKRMVPNVALAQAVVAPAAATAAGAGASESQASVGTYATTGKACPASGWWRSEDSHALDGTRWFAAGSVLPAATFAVPPGVFGKAATGTPKTIQRHGTWMLVRLAQASAAGGNAGETGGAATDQARPNSPRGSAA